MGLIDNIATRFMEATPVKEAINRAYEAGFYDGGNDDPQSGDIKAGKQGYKRISDNYVREGAIDFERAINTAWQLYQKSPIAKRVLAMKRDHIIGHNAMPSCEDDAVNELIKSFWMDNKLDKRASQYASQLFLFGEQCFPMFVREADGRTRNGYIDPKNILKVVKHPDNSLEDWGVVVATDMPREYRVYRIIREDESYVDEVSDVQSKYPGKMVTWEQAVVEPWEIEELAKIKGQAGAQYDGSCFYYKVNSVSNQSRGMSDLLQVADWIDAADEVLFALADREQFAGYFAFDVTLDGADDAQIKKWVQKRGRTAPKKGSMNVHNESEMWQQWAPNLGQTGTIETFRAILGLILGGMGFPVHWYGFGDDANRATAVAQSDPTAKSLEHDQGTVKSMLLNMCQFAIDQAVIAGKHDDDTTEEYELTLDLPEVNTRDMSRTVAALLGMVQALAGAQQQGWMSEQTAATVWAKMLNEIDVEIDPNEELKQAAKEKERADLDNEQRRNNALNANMNGQGPSQNGDMADELAYQNGGNGGA